MTITEATKQKLTLISASDSEQMVLDSYVLHRSRQICFNCDCIEAYSTLFEVWTHPTKTRTTGLTSLRIPTGRLKKLPLAHITLPKRIVPVCDDCIEDFELEGEPALAVPSREEWNATLRRKYAEAPKTESSSKTTPTVEML